jgi:hypothetical protein
MSVNDVNKDSYSSISFIWLYKKNLFPIYLYWYYCSLTFPYIHSLFCKEKNRKKKTSQLQDYIEEMVNVIACPINKRRFDDLSFILFFLFLTSYFLILSPA